VIPISGPEKIPITHEDRGSRNRTRGPLAEDPRCYSKHFETWIAYQFKKGGGVLHF